MKSCPKHSVRRVVSAVLNVLTFSASPAIAKTTTAMTNTTQTMCGALSFARGAVRRRFGLLEDIHCASLIPSILANSSND